MGGTGRSDIQLNRGGFVWLLLVATHEARRLHSGRPERPAGTLASEPEDRDEPAEPVGLTDDPLERVIALETHRERVTRWPGATTVLRVFGSWNAAHALATRAQASDATILLAGGDVKPRRRPADLETGECRPARGAGAPANEGRTEATAQLVLELAAQIQVTRVRGEVLAAVAVKTPSWWPRAR